MSARKVVDTKIPEDENTDSGFLSGPIDRLPGDEELDASESGFLSGPLDKLPKDEEAEPQKDVVSDVKCVVSCYDLDSGLDLSENLEALSLSERQQQAQVDADIPPLAFLFHQDDDGDTQLHIAAVHGCVTSVGTLIGICPDKYWLDLPNDYGHTALHLAVMSGHAIVARMLVQAGASIGQRDLRGDTPIHTATRGKHVECLQSLLAPIEMHRLQKNLATILNLKNYGGQSCVHIAATSGHIPTLKTLIYYGADVNVREGLAGWTALHIAARRGDAPLATFLMERANAAARARDYAGRTPRRLARAHQTLARLFRAYSTDSDSESDDEDEYDSEDPESLFERMQSSMAAAPVATN